MDILLVGGDNGLMKSFINKLNKEGHRTYILTGHKGREGSYRGAYERYRFPYDSDCLKEIFESVRPDVTVFFGSTDSNFDWGDARRESVRYLTALQNVLTNFSALGRGRFVYLSSEEVYSKSYPNDIDEEEPTDALSFRGNAIAQGEEVCRNYRRMMGTDAVTLRLDHPCCMPEREHGEGGDRVSGGICTRMCVEGVRTGYVQANGNIRFSMMYADDVVEAAYKVIASEQMAYDLYNISSGEVTDELGLAKRIAEEMGQDVTVTNNTIGNPVRVVLSAQRFAGEFGLTIFHHIDEITEKTAKYVKNHSADFVDVQTEEATTPTDWRQRLRLIFWALVPFIENFICFIPFFMLNNRAVGSRYFANLDFYLLYVLLFAIVYGQQQATISAVLSVAGYIFRQMYHRTGLEVMLDYNTYVWIAQLFILGLVIGYMRDQLKTVRGENKHELQYMEHQLNDIEDINTSNNRIKNMLEVQLVNQNDSFGKIYEITSSLDQYEPSEVLFYAAEVLGQLVDSRDVAIYTVANRSYARLFSATSKKARELGNSIEYTKMESMYEMLRERRVYVNRSMDKDYPLMADAIYAEDEEMQLILMVWGIPWERMTLSQANMLVIVGYLIQNAVLRANRYMAALESQRYLEGTKIMEPEAFTTLVKAYQNARAKGLTECAVLEIDLGESPLEDAGQTLASLVRQSDYIGTLDDGKLYALLSNTEDKDADFVMKRFANSGYQSRIREEIEIA